MKSSIIATFLLFGLVVQALAVPFGKSGIISGGLVGGHGGYGYQIVGGGHRNGWGHAGPVGYYKYITFPDKYIDNGSQQYIDRDTNDYDNGNGHSNGDYGNVGEYYGSGSGYAQVPYTR